MPSAISRNRARCSSLARWAPRRRAAAPARAHLEDEQLLARVGLGHEDALARQDRHQSLAGEPLQRLADGRAADLQAGRQRVFGEELAGLQPQRDDLLLQLPVGLLRQGLRACGLPAGRRAGGFS